MVGPLIFAHSPALPDAVYPDAFAMAREIRNASAGVFAALRIATLTRRARPNGQGVCVHVGEDEHILGYVFDQKGADAFVVLDQLTHALRVADREAAERAAAGETKRDAA